MGIDAVALLRPKNHAVLRKHGRRVVRLEDGSVLFLTLMRYEDFETDPAGARAYLESAFGCALRNVQDDAADGYIFVPHLTPHGLDDFVERVVPELQEMGVHRSDYEGTTLREHLGLGPAAPRPLG